jgi:hypothetical protein
MSEARRRHLLKKAKLCIATFIRYLSMQFYPRTATLGVLIQKSFSPQRPNDFGRELFFAILDGQEQQTTREPLPEASSCPI